MQIVPAILEKTFKEARKKIKLIDAKFDPIQIDICDGKFVKTKTWQNPAYLKRLNTESSFEIHLMVAEPRKEVKKWQFKKIRRIVFHYEALENNFSWIKKETKKIPLGLAINPETKLEKLKEVPLNLFEEILFLGVNPGKQGQKFQESVLKRIKDFSKIRWRPKKIKIAVDGGINDNILMKLYKLKIDYAVIGSYFWKSVLKKSK